MLSSQMNALIVGAVGLGLVGISSVPALLRLYRPRKGSGNDEIQELYEDEDGAATEESQKTYLYSAVIPRYLILASSVIGLLFSIAAAVIGTVRPSGILFLESWLLVGGWGFLVIQALNLFLEHSCVKRYDFGIQGSIASTLLVLALCYEIGLLISQGLYARANKTYMALTTVQLAVAAFLSLFFLSLPRRPTLFVNGLPVDRQFSVSAIGRYTFVWGGDLLAFARRNKGLDLKDLPILDQLSRADDLQKRFNSMKKRSRLWKAIFMSHASVFMLLCVLVVFSSILQFSPQLAMYSLLRLLEQRAQGASVALVAWAWVFGLGFSMIISSWLEAWLFWIVWSKIGISMRVELSALIFMKAMRRKDVKGVSKDRAHAKNGDDGNQPPIINKSSGQEGKDTASSAEKKAEGGYDDNDALQKSRQSTINLVGVDGKRVSDFASWSYLYPSVLSKLIVSMTFLCTIIGLPSLLAGFAVFGLTIPLNIYCSKKYSDAQGDLMKARDQKMGVMTEALQGIRQIKFSSLEFQWEAKIGEIRKKELDTQRKVFMYDTWLISMWILGPVMLSAVSLAVYASLHGGLSPAVAFTTIAVFGAIEMTLAVIPELTTNALDAFVSINRIEKYLKGPDKEDNTLPSDRVEFEDASIAWPSDSQEDPDRYILRNINLRFPNHELSIISGPTGSGKSLLLAAILGEADKLSGTIQVPRPVDERFDHKATRGNWLLDSSKAFVAQTPWIENATIRDNILFGLPFDSGRYQKTLSSCALEKDLEILPDGELTDIGANGINLSGGQRWRVSFARALYSRAGILVLDDIFSAVDAHVGLHLFEEALTGELGEGRTRILATHHVGLCLPKTKYTVVLGDGTVEHAGSVEDLRRRGSLAEILRREEDEQNEDEEEAQKTAEANGGTLQQEMSRRSEQSAKIDDGELDGKGKSKPKKFTEEEKRETGKIKLAIYVEYLKASGGMVFWSALLSLFASYMGLILLRSFWISLWTRSYTESALVRTQHVIFQQTSFQHHMMSDDSKEPKSDLWFYLSIYVGLSVVVCVVGSLRYLFVFLGSLKASRIMFEKLTYTVLRAPLRWLDTVPVGRILNRFTADFNIIDSRIANDVGFMLYELMQVLGITVAGLFVSLYMLLFAIVLLSICLFVAVQYLVGAREVKRLESNAKSPIFEQFGSALLGVGTIRAFDKADAYVHRMFDRIDDHARTFWHLWLFNRWMGFRLNLVGAIFAVLVATVIVTTKDIDASLAGFALGFALQYTDAIVFALRTYSTTELDMNATERIVEYSRIATEDQSGDDVPAAWPTEGRLEVDNIVVGYAPDLPPILKGLSFSVTKNQRIGVVGRTGAGKSSLTLALFRFLEVRSGSIHIDGLDISKIKLHDLRSRLAIIPQDPVLFSGTVRSNLDAFDEHTDAELYDALERVHLIRSTGLTSRDDLTTARSGGISNGNETPSPTAAAADTNTNIFTSLTSRISEGGLNLSQGQRQLLCLARAIVSRPKIMVLDEATSAVDMATDVLIQRSIREEFTDATLIVIAHRLSTIADFDRILVMSEGVAVEFGEPRELVGKRGVFWEMVRASGEAGRLGEMLGVRAEWGNGNGKGRA